MKYVLLFVCFILCACDSPAVEQKGQSTKPEITATTDIDYEIVRTDKRDPIINLDVYIKNRSKVTELNTFLCAKWNPNKDKSMMIMYFDNKKVASVWHDKLDDQSVSEKEWARLQPHRIAVYNFNPSNGYENFNIDKW